MSMPQMDSFSGYTTPQIPYKLIGGITGGAPVIGANSTGRNGNRSLSISDSGSVDIIVPIAGQGFIVGVAVTTTVPPASAASTFIQIFMDTLTGTICASVALNNLAGFALTAGGTTVQTANSLWAQNSYFHVGLQATVSLVATTLTTNAILYINGIQVATATGTQTTSFANITDVRLRWQQGGMVIAFSDFYLINTTDGIPPTTFPGDLFITPLFADNNGVSTQWTPSNNSNTNFSLINGTSPGNNNNDYNNHYVFTSNVNAIDTYHFPAPGFPANTQVFAVQDNIFVEKDNSGSRSVAPVAYITSTNNYYLGSNVSVGQSYDYYFKSWSQNPGTGNNWLAAEVAGNNSQFGQKLIA